MTSNFRTTILLDEHRLGVLRRLQRRSWELYGKSVKTAHIGQLINGCWSHTVHLSQLHV